MGGCIAFRFQNSPAQDSNLSVWRRKDPRMLSALPLALLAGTFALTTTAVRSCSTPGHSQLNVRLKTLWSNHNDGDGFAGDNEFKITLGTGAPKQFHGLASQETHTINLDWKAACGPANAATTVNLKIIEEDKGPDDWFDPDDVLVDRVLTIPRFTNGGCGNGAASACSQAYSDTVPRDSHQFVEYTVAWWWAPLSQCAQGKTCSFRGTCSDLANNQYKCVGCAAGYAGKDCQTNVDDCADQSCSNNGRCVDRVNSYTCTCNAGYIGADCQINVDDCTGQSCSNNGRCVDRVNSYTCTCNAGYIGANCQTSSVTCGQGTRFDQTKNSCRPCSGGQYQDKQSHRDTACEQQTRRCNQGQSYALDNQYPLNAGAECLKCQGALQYQDASNHRNPGCKDCQDGTVADSRHASCVSTTTRATPPPPTPPPTTTITTATTASATATTTATDTTTATAAVTTTTPATTTATTPTAQEGATQSPTTVATTNTDDDTDDSVADDDTPNPEDAPITDDDNGSPTTGNNSTADDDGGGRSSNTTSDQTAPNANADADTTTTTPDTSQSVVDDASKSGTSTAVVVVIVLVLLAVIILALGLLYQKKASKAAQNPVALAIQHAATETGSPVINNAVQNPTFSLYESSGAPAAVHAANLTSHPDAAAAPPDPGLYGTLASSPEHSQHFYERVVVADAEVTAAGSTDDLLHKLDQIPTVELQVAVDKAAAHCNRHGHFDFVQSVQDALTFANKLLAQHASDRQHHDAQRGRSASLYERPLDAGVELLPDGFTATDAATVHVYTQPTPLYGGLNGALGGWGEGGTAAMKHYMSYAKLMMTACKKLPTYSGRLFRGVCLPPSVVLGTKGVGDILELKAITSTSRTPDVLRDADFLGIGEEGAAQSGSSERTVLQFAALSAVEISRFSALGDAAEEEHGSDNGFVNEDEVLLLPGMRFKIDNITKWHFGVVEVQLHQLPPLPPLPPIRDGGTVADLGASFAADIGAVSDPLGIYSSAAPLYENMDTYLAPDDGGVRYMPVLPPYMYIEMHGEQSMVVSLDPASNMLSSVDQGVAGGGSPVCALASAAGPNPASVYDAASSAGIDADVLVATSTSTGGAAVYSIPLDTGNDFATYDRVRADTMHASSTAPSTTIYATCAGLQESAA